MSSSSKTWSLNWVSRVRGFTSLPASASKWNANHSASHWREFTVRLVSAWRRSQQQFVKCEFIGPKTNTGALISSKSPIKPASCNINPVKMKDNKRCSVVWLEYQTYNQIICKYERVKSRALLLKEPCIMSLMTWKYFWSDVSDWVFTSNIFLVDSLNTAQVVWRCLR